MIHKITINLTDGLLRDLKQVSINKGVPMSYIIRACLKNYLYREVTKNESYQKTK